MPFARGFKTRCENIAQSIRAELELQPSDPLSVDALADYLGAKIITPHEVSGMSGTALRVLLEDDADDWSALTISGNGAALVIHNPTHSFGRRSSDIAHELAHLLLRHSPSILMFAPDGTWTLRTYDEQQEAEATWLSGCLLLPRPALVLIAKAKVPSQETAIRYGVSPRLLQYRTDITGVTQQMRRRSTTTSRQS